MSELPSARRIDSGIVALVLVLLSCAERPAGVSEETAVPSVFLVTLDTVRADALGYEGGPAATPFLEALAAESVLFEQAYTTVPTTLPAHTSIMTGLQPAGHGVHENGRRIGSHLVLLAERLKSRGYGTAAFVSGYPLARRFGLDRGFDHYDDDFGEAVERRAAATTDRALGYLVGADARAQFVWVHYYDAHEPYAPPPPFDVRWQEDPYHGEVSYVDGELARLVTGVREERSDAVVIVVSDHGEGLGDHGEQLHGNLLYQGVMRVPLLVSGPGLEPRIDATPVSTRRIFPTVLDLAGAEERGSLLDDAERDSGENERGDVVVAEAMKPFLQYGWQPQVMAVSGPIKAIRSGDSIEVYDVISDPREEADLSAVRRLEPAMLEVLRTYPLPSSQPVEEAGLDPEARRKLAALGYVSSTEAPKLKADAPRARDMTHLFADLDRGSGLFVRERWAEAIAVFEKVVRLDPGNLMVNLRLAVAYSVTGDREAAERYFEAARGVDPESDDRKRYLALHHCRFGELARAEALLEPLRPSLEGNVAALQCLAQIRLSQSRFPEAAELFATLADLQPDSAAIQLRLGEASMAVGETEPAIAAFEAARRLQGELFDRHLELGVLYLAVRRLGDASRELDRVAPGHPGYPMALFKRAQVSVLRQEVDAERRVRAAYREANDQTRELIRNERLFAGIDYLP